MNKTARTMCHRLSTGTLVLMITGLAPMRDAEAHCQVPCGIYDDSARIHQIQENISTISKALAEIKKLSAKRDAQSKNQLVRWIGVKEAHAEKIIRIVSDYFLTQKIKVVRKESKGYQGYLKRLVDHHGVLAAAMKCKQTGLDKGGSVCTKPLARAVKKISPYWHK